MKLICHIIRKDIVRERWALLLWVLLLVGQAAIGLRLLGDPGYNKDWIEKGQIVNGILVFLQVLLGYMLVARLVHADALLGTEMFWATRPISRGRLLVAKALGAVLVFGLLPVVLLAPWWLWCGFTGRDLFWSGVDTFGWQLLMIAPAFLIASMTRELGRLLLWTILLFVFLMIWAVVLENVFKTGKTENDPTNQFLGVVYSRVWLSCLAFLVCSAALATHQYLTQRLVRSIGLTVAGLGVVVLVGLCTQDNWTMPLARLPLKAPAPEVAAALAAVRVEAGRGLPDTHVKVRVGTEQRLLTEHYFLGLPPGTGVAGGTGRQTWRWADGQRIRRYGFVGGGWMSAEPFLRQAYGLAKPAEDPETGIWRQERQEELQQKVAANRAARGVEAPKAFHRVPSARPEPRTMMYAGVPAALIPKAKTESPAYEATLNYVVTQPVIVAELPLQAGARGGQDSLSARLIDLRQELEKTTRAPHLLRQEIAKMTGVPQGVERTHAAMIFTAPAQRIAGLWGVNFFTTSIRNPMRGEVWLVNRTTGDMVRVENFSLQAVRGGTIGGVQIGWNQMQVNAGVVIRDGKWMDRDPQWREHCSLVVVAEELVDYATTSVKADRLDFLPSLWVEDGDEPSAKR